MNPKPPLNLNSVRFERPRPVPVARSLQVRPEDHDRYHAANVAHAEHLRRFTPSELEDGAYDAAPRTFKERHPLLNALGWFLVTSILTIVGAFLISLLFASRAYGQSTQPAATPRVQYVGVFSQPRSSLAKWKARGVNVLIGSEPEARADGTPSVPQADWRAAARAVGLPYYDRPSASPEDDARDPYLLGFLMDDEVDRRILLPAIDALKTEKDPARRAVLQKTIDDCVAGYKAIADRCRATGKPVLGNFSGPQVTGGYPWYAGQGQLPFLPLITEEGSDWYVVNAKAPPYPIALVGQQLDLLAQWRKAAKLPAAPQWCFLECGFQNKGGGRAPTDDELDAEVAQATARGVKGIVWFPQRFSPFAYDGLTPAEGERLTRVNARLLGGVAQPATLPTTVPAATQPSELDALRAENAQLRADRDAKAATIEAIRGLLAPPATRPAGD